MRIRLSELRRIIGESIADANKEWAIKSYKAAESAAAEAILGLSSGQRQ